MRKIVIVDGYTLNPGDLRWDGLAPFGDVTVYDQTAAELVCQRCDGAEIIFTNKVLFPKDVLSRLKSSLRYIGLLSTGVNVVDLAAASEYGITVANIPAYSTDSVAQLTFAHLLNLTFRLSPFVNSVRDGEWSHSRDFCYWLGPMTELAGLTFGSVGYGNIGQKVCEIARSFGMKTLACNSRNEKRENPAITLGNPIQNPALTLGAMVDLDTVLRESDVVSLHCPLTETNRGMIHAAAIAKMKRTAFFLNTSRGLLVDETALADALNTDRIAGAGLDVLGTEPPRTGSPLITAKNCFITPHIAWGTAAARLRLLNMAVSNLAAFLDGRPQNVVNQPR